MGSKNQKAKPTDQRFDLSTTDGRELWARWHYLNDGFYANGDFKGYKWLKCHLGSQQGFPSNVKVASIVNRLKEPHHKNSFPPIETVSKSMRNKTAPSTQTALTKSTKPAATSKCKVKAQSPTPIPSTIKVHSTPNDGLRRSARLSQAQKSNHGHKMPDLPPRQIQTDAPSEAPFKTLAWQSAKSDFAFDNIAGPKMHIPTRTENKLSGASGGESDFGGESSSPGESTSSGYASAVQEVQDSEGDDEDDSGIEIGAPAPGAASVGRSDMGSHTRGGLQPESEVIDPTNGLTAGPSNLPFTLDSYKKPDALGAFQEASMSPPSERMHPSHKTRTITMEHLLRDDSDDDDTKDLPINQIRSDIRQSPIFDWSILSPETRQILPQYGLLGTHQGMNRRRSKLFLNTNIPFSVFVCGVQGSGKSHTTSCLLENSLIPSEALGKLQNALSALVFHYDHFSGSGSGYSISEAAFLAAPHPSMPGCGHVKAVHVLVSPSNYLRISKLYLRIPNVKVSKFKLKSRNLDIDTMLTLMNVSESEETPLYMAQVLNILRQMSTNSAIFDYAGFKNLLTREKFNVTQENMLKLRLDLLESFLDLDGSCPEPQFKSGEITIMDMSCPFVDANTACTLFQIGLQWYLQSRTPGKMVVLDEAHKYMIKVPGAIALNQTLLRTIRMQRHYGARVIISTQEPTLLTDLIALCSIVVIHRFSSPEWFQAIKRHIPMTPEDRDGLMNRIEGLKTGTAFMYSPNAVFGRGEGNKLVKGSGKMVKISIRKRITSDGGQSVLAV